MSQICKIVLPVACLLSVNLAYADSTNYKRWAVSAGWMHVMPQGKANSTHVTTSVEENGSYGVGSLFGTDIANYATNVSDMKGMGALFTNSIIKNSLKDPNYKVPDSLMKGSKSDITGISDYTSSGGMEVDDTDTLGLTLSYFANDNVSLELVGGIPPKVDIKGVGEIRAVASSTANTPGKGTPPTYLNGLKLVKDTLITDLAAHGTVAEVTAWTPAATVKYHFGTSGKDKFRPFVGAGIVYGHFNKLKIDGGVREDLVQAGYMIDNILNDRAGEALHGGKGSSTATPEVKVKTSDAFAPVFTAGFTYDLTERWFTTGSLSYMPNFNNVATVTVTDTSTGTQLIKSTTKIDFDPLVTYVGVGYRF
ncbi:OmpW/AlkL family protein [Acinetobacter piscicola]|uniref:OmpW/AlkL family protein n=1 Tax=Acinetobacter piscicola TaxID=2006115 RepID=UPI000B7F4622|nr:OmpW family outer membrane protein [Acinetobacter piscicola]